MESLPRRYSVPGDSSLPENSIRIGSCVASQGASNAAPTMHASIVAPMMKRGYLRTKRLMRIPREGMCGLAGER